MQQQRWLQQSSYCPQSPHPHIPTLVGWGQTMIFTLIYSKIYSIIRSPCPAFFHGLLLLSMKIHAKGINVQTLCLTTSCSTLSQRFSSWHTCQIMTQVEILFLTWSQTLGWQKACRPILKKTTASSNMHCSFEIILQPHLTKSRRE